VSKRSRDSRLTLIDMDDLRISCIIPTLNRGRILCETVRMLGQQTYRPHDIIIVDQTAKQDSETERILDALIADKTIVRLRQSEPNASLARNSGARAATGDILLFLDDDISIEPDLLASYARAFSDTSVQAVAGQILEGDAQTVEILSKSQTNTETGWLYFPKNYSGRCETGWMASGNFAIRRERFFEIGGMDSNYKRGAFREESDFAMRFGKSGRRFLFEPNASIYHLGVAGAPEGGSRNWIRNKRIAGWHHCVGDWYFTLNFLNRANWWQLFVASLRHFVFNRYNLSRPWLVPLLLLRWLAALPSALYLRIRGRRLVGSSEEC